MRHSLKNWLLPWIVPFLFFSLWAALAARVANPILLPSPQAVAQNFLHATDNFIGLGSIPKNIFISFIRVLLGYTIGASLGLTLGILMGYYQGISSLLDKFLNAFRAVPPLGYVPLILGWFGVASLTTAFHIPYGPTQVFFDNFKFSMMFIIGIGTFFPVLTNAAFAVRSVERTLIESGRVLGASPRQLFTKIIIPAASPAILTGLRTGLGSAWACLVAAEMLPGSLSGVGYMITHAYELARTDLVITGIICIGLVGALLDSLFLLLEKKKLSWQGR